MPKPGGDPSYGMSFSFDTLVATASSEAIAFSERRINCGVQVPSSFWLGQYSRRFMLQINTARAVGISVSN